MPRLIVILALVFSVLLSTGEVVLAQAPASFVYVITNPRGENSVAAYRRDRDSGALSLIGTFPTGGRGTGRIVDSQSPLATNELGTFLYAVNPASSTISVMAIHDDGMLSLVGEPIESGGIFPASIAIHGDLVYVANKGDSGTPANYTGFRAAADGRLVPISRSTVTLNVGDNPGQVLFNRAGTALVGTRIGGGAIDTFSVRQTGRRAGRLRRVSEITGQAGPFGAAFNPADDEQLVITVVNLPGAAAFRVFSEGEIVPVNTVSNAPQRSACWVAIHPNGRYVWTANTGSNSVSLYVLRNNGAVRLIAHRDTSAFGRLPFELAVDRAGKFLYELNVAPGTIHVMQVTDDEFQGALQDTATFDLPPGSTPIGLVILER